jgi:hypothetical protein
VIARPATPGRWCDASTRLTRSAAKAVKAAGYVGIVRTLPLPGNPDETLADELLMLTEEGLEVSLYQRVRGFPPAHPLWRPADHDGALDGGYAAHYASRIGVPLGVHLWQDLEAVDGTSGETIAFCLRWGRAVVSVGYGAALYGGYSVPMTPQEKYNLPDHNRYGSDLGHHDVATRGLCWRQTAFDVHVPYEGVLVVDDGVFVADALGDLPVICAAG